MPATDTAGRTTTRPRARARSRSGLRARVACFPPALPSNPYLHLLYAGLALHGIEQEPAPRLKLGWLLAARRRVRTLHLHWPEGLYRHERGPAALRGPLSWVKLALFAARLLAARALGYRIVWTVHQVRPHETTSRARDAIAAAVLARTAHALVTHERATARAARSALHVPERRVTVIPHGSYVGVYPEGRPAAVVRPELGIPAGACCLLCFGELRPYKGIELLLDAFAGLPPLAPVHLVVAGHPKDPALAARVEAAAAADARIVPLLRFVEPEQVSDLFAAADAAVLPRGDGGTSGSLLLALSLGTPVVAAATPGTAEVLRGARAGWLFRPNDADALRDAILAVAASRTEAQARGRAALALAQQLGWPEIAGRTADVLAPRRAS